jgi:eukaryotic-like serine/threonine-protein kinase
MYRNRSRTAFGRSAVWFPLVIAPVRWRGGCTVRRGQMDTRDPQAPASDGPDTPVIDATRSAATSSTPYTSLHLPDDRLAAPLQVRDRERYEVIGEHARGGLGRVLRARDKEIGRDVAIKELITRGDVGEIRFLKEALITARLEHPAIVPIHEAGRWSDGTPFYAMKLVAGRPLKDLLAACTTVDERLALLHHVIAVADAIAYAHERRIIHRDLKPGNVIVGDFGETIVIDWGLAKELSAVEEPPAADAPYRAPPFSELTAAGSVVGTPAYMAPEQARGERVDERADVFAIGAMLWELCAGERVPPTDRRLFHGLLRRGGIDKDLATIIDKAVALHPEDRYRNAGALAADLKAFRAGTRIAARSYSLAAMLAHWIRRHRKLSISVLAAVLVAIAGSLAFVHNIERERERAEQARDELTLQHAALQLHTDPTAAAATLASYRGSDAMQLQRLRAEALGRGVATALLQPHSDTIWFLADDGNGAMISIGEDRLIRLTRGRESTTLATDVSTHVVGFSSTSRLLAYTTAPSGIAVLALRTRETRTIATPTPSAMDIAQDGSKLAAFDSRGVLTIWALTPEVAVIRELPIPNASTLMFVTPTRLIVQQRDGLRVLELDSDTVHTASLPVRWQDAHAERGVIAGDDQGNVVLMSPALAVRSTVRACRQGVNFVNFVPRTDLVAFACEEGVAGVARHDRVADSLRIVDTFSLAGLPAYARPDALGRYIVAFDTSSYIYVYDIATKLVTRYDGQAAQISCVAPSTPTFDHLLVGDVNGAVRVWDPPAPGAKVVLKGTGVALGVAFTPDGQSLFTGGIDQLVRRIRLSDGAVTELRGHTDLVWRVIMSPDGQYVLSHGYDRTVRRWNVRDATPAGVLAEHTGIVRSARYIDSGRRVVSCGDDGRLLVWSPDSNEVSVRFSRPLPLKALEVLRHNEHVVVQDAAGSIWDVAPSGQALRVRTGDGSTVTLLRASPDGRMLATGTHGGLVVVYDTISWVPVVTAKVDGSVRQITFDPGNRDLIVASEDRRVRAIALSAARTLPWHDVPMMARNVVYGPDGETIAFVCGDGGTWFYDIRSNTWAYTRDHASETFTGAFSPDGALFVSADARGIVTLRDVPATFTKLKTHIERK